MNYIVFDWGIVFGIWITLIFLGIGICYFLFNHTTGEDKHLSA